MFVESVFSEKSFNGEVPLVIASADATDVAMPDGVKREQFEGWIGALKDHHSPEWIGLPRNAENILLIGQGKDCVAKLLKLQQVEDEEELDVVGESEKAVRILFLLLATKKILRIRNNI